MICIMGLQQGRKAFSLQAAGSREFRGRDAGVTTGIGVDYREKRGLCYPQGAEAVAMVNEIGGDT